MAAALPEATDPLQVQWWAAEVLEIVVLDYLLGQQDRIGNIDYQWRWLWWQDGGLRSVPAEAGASPPAQATRLRISWLNDNDAGVRRDYTNFAERTGMVQGLRRFDPGLYRRLRELAADFAARGRVFQAVAANYGLHQGDLDAIARRLHALNETLLRDCRAGHYQFDLGPSRLLAGVDANTENPACD
jgi:hypothetical protein